MGTHHTMKGAAGQTMRRRRRHVNRPGIWSRHRNHEFHVYHSRKAGQELQTTRTRKQSLMNTKGRSTATNDHYAHTVNSKTQRRISIDLLKTCIHGLTLHNARTHPARRKIRPTLYVQALLHVTTTGIGLNLDGGLHIQPPREMPYDRDGVGRCVNSHGPIPLPSSTALPAHLDHSRLRVDREFRLSCGGVDRRVRGRIIPPRIIR